MVKNMLRFKINNTGSPYKKWDNIIDTCKDNDDRTFLLENVFFIKLPEDICKDKQYYDYIDHEDLYKKVGDDNIFSLEWGEIEQLRKNAHYFKNGFYFQFVGEVENERAVRSNSNQLIIPYITFVRDLVHSPAIPSQIDFSAKFPWRALNLYNYVNEWDQKKLPDYSILTYLLGIFIRREMEEYFVERKNVKEYYPMFMPYFKFNEDCILVSKYGDGWNYDCVRLKGIQTVLYNKDLKKVLCPI